MNTNDTKIHDWLDTLTFFCYKKKLYRNDIEAFVTGIYYTDRNDLLQKCKSIGIHLHSIPNGGYNFEQDKYSTEWFKAHSRIPITRFPDLEQPTQTIIDGIPISVKVLSEPIAKGEVYINLMEDDLVKILDRVLESGMTIGKDIGVISYNETPLKKFILNGITTILTDFAHMGTSAARMIIDKSIRHEEVPFYLILRASI